MKKRNLIFVAVMLVVAATTLVACDRDNDDTKTGINKTAAVPTSHDVSAKLSAVEAAGDIDLSDLSACVSEDGATVLDNENTSITTAGKYVLSGEYGGITVSVNNEETVQLFLKNATIKSSDGAALTNSNKKSTLIVTACENSENEVITEAEDSNAIFVKGTLFVNGDGTINVRATKNGIKVSKGFSITDATINATAKNHGVSARFLKAENCTINVLSAEKDGVNIECDVETQNFTLDEGYVAMKNSTYSARVCGDGIQADTFVFVKGGKIDVKTEATFVSYSAENAEKYSLAADDFRFVKSGETYKKVADDERLKSVGYAMTGSAKGIKCGEIKYELDGTEYVVSDNANYFIVLDGAEVDINSSDDGIHTNSGNVAIKGGNVKISTLDDGIHADELVKISGGEIKIDDCYEGIEGAYVEISGGKIDVTASDDGINAASDDETVAEHIIISGGEIKIDASGDGIDSNGTLYISGGSLIVFGPTTGADSGLDSDGGILINGGTVFSVSSKEMIEIPATNSAQNVLVYGGNGNISAGTTITIKDLDGKEIFSATLEKQAQAIIYSSSTLVANGTYSLYAGDNLLASVSITDTITTVGVNGGGRQDVRPNGGPRR